MSFIAENSELLNLLFGAILGAISGKYHEKRKNH